jgi:hypothetical protein
MNNISQGRLWAVTLVAGVVGAISVLVVQLGIDKLAEPTKVDGISEEVGEAEPSLEDAIHAAAEEAVEIEDGKFKGESLKIARIEVTANNPHITAYRVVLSE